MGLGAAEGALSTGFGGRPRGHGGCTPSLLMTTSLRVAAVGDLHCTRTSEGVFQPLFAKIAESADVLVLCGDLTDYGTPEEARVLARELAATKLPKIAVLGNHDFESERVRRGGAHPDRRGRCLGAGRYRDGGAGRGLRGRQGLPGRIRSARAAVVG